MNEDIINLYKLPDINKYEDVHLLALSEQCATLEERVLTLIKTLPKQDRLMIEDYIQTRNDLEFETFKTALRWGKTHYK